MITGLWKTQEFFEQAREKYGDKFVSEVKEMGCIVTIFDGPSEVDKAKNIVTGASIFILLNSLSGIMGQITKNDIISELLNFWPLFVMVIIGGQLGNFLNLKILSSKILTLITSALVLFLSFPILN